MRINAVNVNLPRINNVIPKERVKVVSFGATEDSFSKAAELPTLEKAKETVKVFYNAAIQKIKDTFDGDAFGETTKKAEEFIRSDSARMAQIGSVARAFSRAEDEIAQGTDQGKTLHAARFIKRMMTEDFVYHEYSEHKRHCAAVFSKQSPETAKKFLEFSEFYEDMEGIFGVLRGDSDEFFHSSFRVDREVLSDTFSTHEEFQQAIMKKLKSGKEKFEKTGRKTVLTVEGIEKLLRPDTASDEGIAVMKDIMQKTDRRFATQLRFTASEHKALDVGIGGCNRIVARTEIDKLGITRQAVAELDSAHDLLQPVIDEVRRIYTESPGIQERIAKNDEVAQLYCKASDCEDILAELYQDTQANRGKIEEFLAQFKLPEEKVEEAVEETVKDKVDDAAEIVKKNTSNFAKKIKPVAIVLGAAAIIGGGIYLMKKKGVSFKSNKQSTEKIENNQPVQGQNTVQNNQSQTTKPQNAFYALPVKTSVPEIFKSMG